ncbi:MAG: SUMF1/EgtB/PvdO family nonheme iron enzyme [Byssovorax sp.]
MTRDLFQLVGTVVEGSFLVDALVGEGSYGIVYRGLHLVHMTPIAFKVLRMPAQIGAIAKEALFAKFEEEAEALMELSERHPAFVRVIDKGLLPGPNGPVAPYLVMEWLNGETLESEMARRRATRAPGRSLDETINLLTPIAEALELSHHERIVHKNLTPADVFLVDLPDGVKAKLLDVGVARMMSALEKVAPPLQSSGPGFPMRYGAPEQWNVSYGQTGAATDVYALALICVEVLSGKPALGGDEPGQLMGATIDPNDRPTPQSRGVSVPIGVELVFRQALSLPVKNRYPNAGLFWDALCDAAGSNALGPKSSKRPPKGSPSSVPRPMHSGAPPAPRVAPSTPSPAAPAARKVPRAALVTAGVIVPLAALAVGLGMRSPGAAQGEGAPSASAQAPAPVPASASAPEPAASTSSTASTMSTASTTSTASAPPLAPAPSATAPAASCPEGMALIEGGTFVMGSSDYADEKPPHEVKVPAFCLDLTEVTAGAYAACVGRHACRPAEAKSAVCNGARGDRLDHPMNCVDHPRADAYCRAQQKRLPTEEQWEYAARGGSERRTFPWGDKEPAEQQLCWSQWNGTSPLGTCPVGSHPASDGRWGVHDLAGNVWEWTDTWLCADYTKKSCPRKLHVLRGGSWSVGLPPLVRSAFRGGPARASGGDDVGFRCAKPL